MKWHLCSVNHPVLQFLRPNLSNLNDRDCLTLSTSCRSLRFLHLQQCNITDTGLRALASLPYLLDLKLDQCDAVACTSDGLQVLGTLTQLEKLCIENVCRGEQHGLKLGFVTQLKCLRKLSLDHSKITDVGLADLGTSSLTSLSLVNCLGTVTTSGLQRVARLNDLRELELGDFMGHTVNNQIDIVAVVQALPKGRELRKLHVGSIRFDDTAAQSVCDVCPELTSLSFSSSPITDIGARSRF